MDTPQTPAGLAQAIEKLEADGASPVAIEVFSFYWKAVAGGDRGVITEDEITPVVELPHIDDLETSPDLRQDALSKTVLIKLNGGLGTSMGLNGPKSLLSVRDGMSFLDLIARQVLAARERFGVKLPLLLMDSFSTQAATLDALGAYPELAIDGLPLDFVQSREPKILADTLAPATWPKNPNLEWCPPGHGDIYPSLLASGLLDQLIDKGYRYAHVSNSDNLGSFPDPELAGWFAESGLEFAMEVCRRTVNDRKGGHLARRKSDGLLVLRELAQTAKEDQAAFSDINKHHFFNTNSLWFDLLALRKVLDANHGVLGLPLIRNEKSLDPVDLNSPRVIQMETAMGAAIEKFDNAGAIEVERDRFLPVKTTNELALVRSDLYELTSDFHLVAKTDSSPAIDLDPKFFRTIDDFEKRIPHPLLLTEARSLTVEGDWTFGDRVRFVGDVVLNTESKSAVAAGQVIGENGG